VRRLIDEFNWRLLIEQEFVERTVETAAGNPAMTPIQAALNVYSRELYHACQGARRQEQAYGELHDYLYRKACYRRPDLARDATQEAIKLVFEQIKVCRNPGTFLRFAEFKLLHAYKIVERQFGRETQVQPPFPEPSPEGSMVAKEQITALLYCIRHVWETHPRARNQLRAVLYKYFDELSDGEIGTELNKTPSQVHVLRSRGIKRLRRCLAERD
jgi:DNA-directed RNA polymerase specialized sigma24 family protein